MTKKILYIEGNTDGTVGGSYFLMYDLVNGLDRTLYEPIVGFHRDNFLVERLRKDGIEVIVFPQPEPFVFRWNVLNRLFAPLKKLINLYRGLIVPARAHRRFLRERQIDLVNLNNSIERNHPWMLAAMLNGTRCITHEMGINTYFGPLSRFFGRRLERIICLSHAIHDGMKKCGIDYPNIDVIHCGIDLKRYRTIETPEELRKKHGLAPGAPVIGVVGNVRMWKGQETLVRAMPILKQTFPDIRCILVGDSTEADRDYRANLERLCREAGTVENVIFAGFQRNAIDYMELMDVVAHTSVHPEPFGIVTLEAMSRSKPLVSTTIGGPAEVVINGETGLLVEPGKPELLAAAIRELLLDKERSQAMGKKGYQRLLSDFGLQKNLDRTMDVYAQILGQRPRPLTTATSRTA
jgi:glycosyltransferase involved in cell wall biosynthesis